VAASVWEQTLMSTSQKVKFTCSKCGREFTWKPEIAGRKAKCKCGTILTVPKQPPRSAPPPPEPDEFDLAGDMGGDMGGDIGGDIGAEDDLAAPPPPPPPLPTPAAASAAAPAKPKLKLGSSSDDSDTWKWWYYVLAGVASVPLAIYQYFRLLDYEERKANDTGLKNFESFVYGIAGKWGVCIFIVCVGAVLIAIGLHKFRKQREAA
jgi:hypothetical protein